MYRLLPDSANAVIKVTVIRVFFSQLNDTNKSYKLQKGFLRL